MYFYEMYFAENYIWPVFPSHTYSKPQQEFKIYFAEIPKKITFAVHY